MSRADPIKLIPRNVAALRRGQTAASATALVAGNPVSTRLESGVGNCFPGLECDLRNLERRFFPLLEVDIADTAITVVGVNIAEVDAGLAAGRIAAEAADTYRRIETDVSQSRLWHVTSLVGTFGPLGSRTLAISALRPGSANGDPPDAWTAIRLLTEGSAVQLTLRRGSTTRTLAGPRERYLDDKGALAAMFLPGELTQSLCSPWTHDFRDCGCFYWASNHPDIAQPPRPDVSVTDPEWNAAVPWERSDRNPDVVPMGAVATDPVELNHYEINQRWQELNFVIEGRELLGSYVATAPTATPFANAQQLDAQLRYAAGVELAVMQAYLTAAYSLRTSNANASLTEDITAAHAELMRIAIGEMRHLRVVNNVLSSTAQTAGIPFIPALRVARLLPGDSAPWVPRAATPVAITDFIRLEAATDPINGLYARILATVERDGSDEQAQSVRSIMAEGEDHFETFEFIQEWLGRHQPAQYLRGLNLAAPPISNASHLALQQMFKTILQRLHAGYLKGLPAGATEINLARTSMVQQPDGLAATARAVADAGFLVVFDPLTDPRFAPIDPPAP